MTRPTTNLGLVLWATDVDPDRNRQFRTLADSDYAGRKPADPDRPDAEFNEDAHER